MLKGVGLGIVCASCVLFGISRKLRLQREVEIIEKLSGLILELQEEIVYGKYPLSECFCRIAGRGDGDMRELFLTIHEMCRESNEHPLVIFTEALSEYLRKNAVSAGVQKELLSCIVIGNMEEDMQYRLLEQSAKRLERLYELQVGQSKEKEKLAVTLGVMGGCFFFLFFI